MPMHKAIFKYLKRIAQQLMLDLADMLTFEDNRYLRSVKLRLLSALGVHFSGDSFIDSGFRCLNAANIYIGKYSSFGHDMSIWAFNKVYIGSYCQSAKDLLIISGGHDQGTMEPLTDNQEVIISDGVWIGAWVTILGGTHIGYGCIIGAGAVVKGVIPEFTIIGGIPAKKIKDRPKADMILSPFGQFKFNENGNAVNVEERPNVDV